MACANCTNNIEFTCILGPGRFTNCPSRRSPCSSDTKSRTTPAPASLRLRLAAKRVNVTWRFLQMSSAATSERTVADRALEVLRRAGNPFRNYFARNPDDEVCARYHVPELFAAEREQLLGVVDLYRYDPATHSEIVPVLGNKGARKTHLLHSIKHGGEGAWQLLVTPGTYQKDTDFLEYLLFQVIDTLLGGGTQKGGRPLEFVGEELVRRLLHKALSALAPEQRLDLFPAP